MKPPIPPSNLELVVGSHQFLAMPEEELVSQKRPKGLLEMAFQKESQGDCQSTYCKMYLWKWIGFQYYSLTILTRRVEKTNEAPKGYKSLRYEVCSTLLKIERKLAKDSIKPIWDFQANTRVSIISNGWKYARNRILINVIAVSPKGAMFFRVMDCEGQVKDG